MQGDNTHKLVESKRSEARINKLYYRALAKREEAISIWLAVGLVTIVIGALIIFPNLDNLSTIKKVALLFPILGLFFVFLKLHPKDSAYLAAKEAARQNATLENKWFHIAAKLKTGRKVAADELNEVLELENANKCLVTISNIRESSRLKSKIEADPDKFDHFRFRYL